MSVISQDNQNLHKPLPLFYVSSQAASDRSPTVNPLNGPGVYCGWYTIAQPSQKYAVRAVSIDHINKFKRLATEPYDESLCLYLFIDGCDVKSGRTIQKNACFDSSVTWLGFVRDREIKTDSRQFEDKISRFQFSDAREASSSSSQLNTRQDANDCAKIQVLFRMGVRGKPLFNSPLRSTSNNVTKEIVTHQSSVDEELIAKTGISLKTKASEEKTNQILNIQPHISCGRRLPHLDMTIFVREKSWLQSRNIIDGNSNPCSYDNFKKQRSMQAPRSQLPFSGNKRSQGGGVISVDDDIKPKKLCSAKKEIKLEPEPITAKNENDCTTFELS